MKTAFKILMILAVAGFLVWSFTGVKDKAEDKVCTGWTLEVQDSLSLGLITQEEVMEIIKNKKITFQGKKISDINMSYVERALSKSPYIDTVTCNLSANGKVLLTVVPKIPTLHIIADNGEEYYIDRHGDAMPLGNLIENLCIATGKITRKYARKNLAELGCCIQDSAFWRAQIQQIDVEGPHDVRLYTRISDHVVLLGDPDNIPDKLWRLRVFYEKGLPKTGWNLYKAINVEYEDIVIAQRKVAKKDNMADIIPAPAPAPTTTTTETNSTNNTSGTTPTSTTDKTETKKETSTPTTKEETTTVKKEAVTPAKKETATPAKKETATATKKETVTATKKETATPTKKETVTPTKKETVTPAKKETVTATKKETNKQTTTKQ